MKRDNEVQILVSSTQVTELIKKLAEKGVKAFPKENKLNLADYSTKFENIK